MNLYNRDQLACIEILESFHINPHDFSIHGATDRGYYVFQRDEDGRKVMSVDHFMTEPRPWPKGFPVDTFLEHLERHRGSM